jgi:hypothetical protein
LVQCLETLSDGERRVRSRKANGLKKQTCCVLISTLESQHPKPGCEWYQPTTISGLERGMDET